MAKSQDVRSVDSFSQLPFIRPATPPPQQPRDTIRLFGCEFSNDLQLRPTEAAAGGAGGAGSPNAANGSTVTSEGSNGGGTKNGAGAATAAERKFECHYCCRNFPTSQALGGHQNAHKRERQHAKRAHLQASLAMHRYIPGHMYGLFNYHHIGGRFDHPSPPPLPPPAHYSMWTSAAPGGFAGPGSMAQPINGSPVQGLWSAPPPTENFGTTAGRQQGSDRATVAGPPSAGEVACKDEKVPMSLLSLSPSLSSCSSTSPEMLGRCELGQEGVSLDLHL